MFKHQDLEQDLGHRPWSGPRPIVNGPVLVKAWGKVHEGLLHATIPSSLGTLTRTIRRFEEGRPQDPAGCSSSSDKAAQVQHAQQDVVQQGVVHVPEALHQVQHAQQEVVQQEVLSPGSLDRHSGSDAILLAGSPGSSSRTKPTCH